MKKIRAHLIGNKVSSNSEEAFYLNERSSFGESIGEKIIYSFPESLYLLEKRKMEIFSQKRKLSYKKLLEKLHRKDKRIQTKYSVFKNLREKGYVVKTALKFGADFRVYEKNSHARRGHAKWIIFADHESKKISWHEFSAKNRVAHSTKKKLLLAIVDEEDDVSYYEVSCIKP